jgi:pimeloyl-ACP methyl ester carboxylesterase
MACLATSELTTWIAAARLGGPLAAAVVECLRARFGTARPPTRIVAASLGASPRTVRRLYAALDATRPERVRALANAA